MHICIYTDTLLQHISCVFCCKKMCSPIYFCIYVVYCFIICYPYFHAIALLKQKLFIFLCCKICLKAAAEEEDKAHFVECLSEFGKSVSVLAPSSCHFSRSSRRRRRALLLIFYFFLFFAVFVILLFLCKKKIIQLLYCKNQ